MHNLSEKMKSQRNFLERIAEKVSGYGGYRDRERRRDADKGLRAYLSERLSKVRKTLTDLATESANEKSLQSLDILDQLNRQIEKVADKIRFANYGYAGLFAQLKISDKNLDQLYDYDYSLLLQVEEIEKKSENLGVGNDMKSGIQELQKLVKQLDNSIDERDRVARNLKEDKQ